MRFDCAWASSLVSRAWFLIFWTYQHNHAIDIQGQCKLYLVFCIKSFYHWWMVKKSGQEWKLYYKIDTWEEVIFLSTWAFCRSFSFSESSFSVSCRKNLSSTSVGIKTWPIWKNLTSANTPLSFSVQRSTLLHPGGQAVDKQQTQTSCSINTVITLQGKKTQQFLVTLFNTWGY